MVWRLPFQFQFPHTQRDNKPIKGVIEATFDAKIGNFVFLLFQIPFFIQMAVIIVHQYTTTPKLFSSFRNGLEVPQIDIRGDASVAAHQLVQHYPLWYAIHFLHPKRPHPAQPLHSPQPSHPTHRTRSHPHPPPPPATLPQACRAQDLTLWLSASSTHPPSRSAPSLPAQPQPLDPPPPHHPNPDPSGGNGACFVQSNLKKGEGKGREVRLECGNTFSGTQCLYPP